jgi:lipoprotein-releasing system permease protein
MRLLIEIAITHILGRGRQTLVAGLGVALGVGFSVAMAALMQGSQDDFIRQLVDTMPHVQIDDDSRSPSLQPAEQVFDVAAFSGLRPREDLRGIRNPTAAIAALEAWVPGEIAHGLRTQGVIRYSGRDAGVAIVGIEPRRETVVSSVAGDFTAGSFDALAAGGNNVVMGVRLAERLGAAMGTTVDIVSASGLSRGFRIVGLFHTGSTQRDEGEVYVLLKNAQILAERPNAINDIRIRLADPNAARSVATRAEVQLGYKAVSWEEANESIMEVLIIRNVIMYTVVAAILLVAGFGIFNIVSTITHEKARDIAILKSLGFREADMRRLFLLQGLTIGAGGMLLGWAFGYGLSLLLAQIRFELRGPTSELTGLPLAWSFWHYAIAGGLALVAAGVAGYLPARRAARLNPVDIIRGAT